MADKRVVKTETIVRRYNAAGELVDTTRTVQETENPETPPEPSVGMYL